MAGNVVSSEEERAVSLGVIRKAMAFRVKCRIVEFGQMKRRLLILDLGVHPDNRGGLYPNEERIKQLSNRFLEKGTDEEEANHNGVVVENSQQK